MLPSRPRPNITNNQTAALLRWYDNHGWYNSVPVFLETCDARVCPALALIVEHTTALPDAVLAVTFLTSALPAVSIRPETLPDSYNSVLLRNWLTPLELYYDTILYFQQRVPMWLFGPL